jgi:hypothetical protein
LWHGTRKTDPAEIYSGKEGFDIKYSSNGLYGKGLYFAKDANYSDDFCHKYDDSDHSKGIFLALVNLGGEHDMSSAGGNRDLIEPPNGKDSIKGKTGSGSSEIYIVHTNKQTYPQYYITYK